MSSDFENGNGKLIKIDPEHNRVIFSPKRIRDARNVWWHIRLTGVKADQEIELIVEGQDTIGGLSHPVYSYDRKTWHRLDDLHSPYKQAFKNDTVWIARNIPYTYSDSLSLAEKMEGKEHVKVSDLCVSEAGNKVKMLRITDSTIKDEGKKMVWVQARQHAFESHTSHVAEAMAWWMTGDEAAELRQKAIVYIVPLMDVDSVKEGAAGKDQKPVDFNRTWTDTPHWKAISSTIQFIDEATKKEGHQLLAFVDIHSPYFGDVNHWYEPEPDILKANARKFSTLYANTVTGMSAANHWADGAIIPVRTLSTLARNYASVHWMGENPRGLTMIMEVSNWKDGRKFGEGEFISSQGLQDYGKALGKSLSIWTQESGN